MVLHLALLLHLAVIQHLQLVLHLALLLHLAVIHAHNANQYPHNLITTIKTFQMTTYKMKYIHTKNRCFFLESLSEGRLYEAGYFHSISQSAKFTIHFVQLTEQKEASEDNTAAVWETVEKITHFGPDVILLYTSKEKTERLLKQQVILIVFPSSSSSSSSFFFIIITIIIGAGLAQW